MASLGQPRSTHINFHDSKLTGILQPALSGNAIVAVICCVTSSELFLEETRSTLQFASRAKLVKTKPQVNEVFDDSSLIKRLQRELAEAQNFTENRENQPKMQHLQAEAQNAAKEAEEKLRCLKVCFMKGGIIPTSLFGNYSQSGNNTKTQEEVFEKKQQKRCRPDGSTGLFVKPQGKQMTLEHSKIQTTKAFSASHFYDDSFSNKENINFAVPCSEAELKRDTLYGKGQRMLELKNEVSILLSKLEKAEQDLATAKDQNLAIQSINTTIEAKAKALTADREFMQDMLEKIINEQKETQKKTELYFQSLVTEKDIQFEKLLEENKSIIEENKAVKLQLIQAAASADVDGERTMKLHDEVARTKSDNSALLEEIKDLYSVSVKSDHVIKQLEKEKYLLTETKSQLEYQLSCSKEENEIIKQRLVLLEGANKGEIEAFKLKSLHTEASTEEYRQAVVKCNELDQTNFENSALREETNGLKEANESFSTRSDHVIRQLEARNTELLHSNKQLEYQLKCSKEECESVKHQVVKLQAITKDEIEAIKLNLTQAEASAKENRQSALKIGDELTQTKSQNSALLKEIEDLKATYESISVRSNNAIEQLETDNRDLLETNSQLEYQLKHSKEESERLNHQLVEVEAANEDEIEAFKLKLLHAESTKETRQSALKIGGKLDQTKTEISALLEEIRDLSAAKDSILTEKVQLKKSIEQLEVQLKCSKDESESVKQQLKELEATKKEEIEKITLKLMQAADFAEENRQSALKIGDKLVQTKSQNSALLEEINNLKAINESISVRNDLAIKKLEGDNRDLFETITRLEMQLKCSNDESEGMKHLLDECEAANKNEIKSMKLKLLQAEASTDESKQRAMKIGDELAEIKAENYSLLAEMRNLSAAKDSILMEKTELKKTNEELKCNLKYSKEETEIFKLRLEEIEATNKDEFEAIKLKLTQAATSAEENRLIAMEIGDELAQTNAKNSSLLEEIRGLSAAKDSIVMEKTELNKTIEQLAYQLTCSQEETEILRKRLEEIEATNKEEINAIKSKLLHAEASLDESRQSALKTGEELALSTSQNSALLEEVNNLKTLNESISARRDHDINKLEADNRELLETNAQLEFQLKCSKDESGSVKHQLEDLEAAHKVEIESAKLKLLQAEASADESRQTASKIGEELAQTKSDISSLLAEIRVISAAKDSILEEKIHLNKAIGELECHLKCVKEENEMFKQRLDEIEAAKKEEIKAIKSKLLHAEASLDESRQNALKTGEELALSTSQNSALLEEVNNLKTLNESISARRDHDINKLEADNRELLETNSQLEFQLKCSKDESDSVKHQLEDLEAAHKVEIESVKLKLLQAEAFADESRQTGSKIGDELAQLKVENSSLLAEIRDITAAKDSILEEKIHLKKAIGELECHLKCVKEENEMFKQRLDEIEAANKEEIKAIKLKLLHAEASLDESRQNALKTGEELALSTSQNSALLEEVNNLKTLNESISVSLDHDINKLEADNRELLETNSQLEFQLKCSKDESDSMKHQLEDLEAAHKVEIESAKLKLLQAEASADESRQTASKIGEELAQTKSYISSLLAEIRVISAAKDSILEEKIHLNKAIGELECHLKCVKEENEIFKQSLEEIKAANKAEVEAITLKLTQAAAFAEENRQSALKIVEDLAQTKSQHSALVEEINDLKAINESILVRSDHTIEQLEASKRELLETNSRLEYQLTCSKEESEKLNHQLVVVEAANKDVIEAFKFKLRLAEASTEETRQSALKVREELDQTKTENSALVEEIRDLSAAKESILTEKLHLSKTIGELEFQLKFSKEETENFQLQLKGLEAAKNAEIKAMKLKLTQAVASAEENRQSALEIRDELVQTKSQNSTLLEEINNLNATNEFIAVSSEHAIKKLEMDNGELLDKNNAIEFQLKCSKDEIESLQHQLKEIEATNKDEMGKIKLKLTQVAAFAEENRQSALKFRDELVQTKSQNSALLEEINVVKAKNEAISVRSDHAIEQLETDKRDLLETNIQLEYQLKRSKEESERLNHQLMESEARNKDETEAFKLKLLHAEASTYESRQSVLKIGEELAQTKTEISALVEEIRGLSAAKDSFLAENLHLKKTNGELEDKLKCSKEETENFQLQLKELEAAKNAEIEGIKLKLTQAAASAEENRLCALEIRDELAQTISQNSALLEEIDSLKAINESTSVRFDYYIKQLETDKRELLETNSQLEYQLKRSKEEIESLQHQLVQVEASNKDEIEALKLKLLQAEGSLDESRQSALIIVKELSESKANHSSLLAEISVLKASKSSILMEKTHLNKTIGELEYKLKCSMDEAGIFKQQFKELEATNKAEIEAITLKLTQATAFAEERRHSALQIIDELTRTKSENVNLLQEINVLKAANESISVRSDHAIKQLGADNRDLLERNIQLEFQLKCSKDESESVKNHLEELKAANEDEIQKIKLKLMKAAASAEENRQSALKIGDELTRTKAQNSSLLEEISVLKAAKNSISKEKIELNESNNQLEYRKKLRSSNSISKLQTKTK
jgi:hypothetical protein